MQHVHEHGLVHRDLKPSNLMLTQEGKVKVLDLGLARLCTQLSAEELTSTGQILGTVPYMAPEQAFAQHAVSIRADIYSLGCTLYKILTGHTPFDGPAYDSPLKMLLAHANEPVPSIQRFRPEVPQLESVFDLALAKDPANRYVTPGEMAIALEPFTGGADLIQLLPIYEPTTADYRLK
jgi:serine/threonine protein kinase